MARAVPLELYNWNYIIGQQCSQPQCNTQKENIFRDYVISPEPDSLSPCFAEDTPRIPVDPSGSQREPLLGAGSVCKGARNSFRVFRVNSSSLPVERCSLNGSQFSEHAANIHTCPMQQNSKNLKKNNNCSKTTQPMVSDIALIRKSEDVIELTSQ